jgi:beta-glucanase (GH16 family)
MFFSSKTMSQNWQLVWSDEFDGTTLNTNNWNIVEGGSGFGNQEKQFYTSRPQNLKVESGNLVITALLENYTVGSMTWKYTSARINSSRKKDFTYGKIEARIKLPTGAGTWPAFWAMGYGSWPSCGEVDILEFVGRQPDQFQSNVHTKDFNGTKGNNFHIVKSYPGISNDFHTYAIEWTSEKIKFFFDGNQYWTFSSLSVNADNYPFNNPLYLIINLAIGGTLGGTVDDSIFPQQLLVDYVRVYRDVSSGGLSGQLFDQRPIFPSIVHENLKIKFPSASKENQVAVFDMGGKQIVDNKSVSSIIDIDFESFTNGVYIVRTLSDNNNFVQKVIKQ